MTWQQRTQTQVASFWLPRYVKSHALKAKSQFQLHVALSFEASSTACTEASSIGNDLI